MTKSGSPSIEPQFSPPDNDEPQFPTLCSDMPWDDKPKVVEKWLQMYQVNMSFYVLWLRLSQLGSGGNQNYHCFVLFLFNLEVLSNVMYFICRREHFHQGVCESSGEWLCPQISAPNQAITVWSHCTRNHKLFRSWSSPLNSFSVEAPQLTQKRFGKIYQKMTTHLLCVEEFSEWENPHTGNN